MRVDRCWFAECHKVGAMVDLDGSHPRSLCPKHVAGVRLALDQPGTYRVSWGRSKVEQLAKLKGQLPAAEARMLESQALLDAYGPPRDPDTGLAQELNDYGGEADPEYRRLERQAFEAETIVSGIHDRMGEVADRTWDHPIVRVEVTTG